MIQQVKNINTCCGFQLFLGGHWIKIITSRDAINAIKWQNRLCLEYILAQQVKTVGMTA
jgi:hypothetical protein